MSPIVGDMPLVDRCKVLLSGDIYCSGALIALLYIKGHPIAFAQAFKAGCVDTRVMNKYVRSVFLLDKTVAFTVIKPFYYTTGHDNILLS
jgi:hypothetical protein